MVDDTESPPKPVIMRAAKPKTPSKVGGIDIAAAKDYTKPAAGPLVQPVEPAAVANAGAPVLATVRFIRPSPLSAKMAKPAEHYTGEIVETGRGVLIVEHDARIPWSNVAVIYPPGPSEAEIRGGFQTLEEELAQKGKKR